MGNRDLKAKSISELRAMAKKAGIAAKREWGKEDFIKALSKKDLKSKPGKPAPKKPKAKKTAPKKPPVKKAAKPAPKAAKPEPKAKTTAKPKTVAKPAKPSTRKPLSKAAQKPASKPKPLDQLTVAELRSLAGELRIPLAGISRKADIMKAIGAPAARKEIKLIPKEKPERAIRKSSPKPKAASAEKTAARPASIPAPAEEKKVEPARPVPPLKERPAAKGMPKAAEEKAASVAPAPPAQREKIPIVVEPFPEPKSHHVEYDGDKVVSMPVTPRRLYVYWEISEETMAGKKGSFNIKITDIRVNSFFYMPISERIGEYFINVSPEGEYSIEVGLINHKGEFVNLAQLQQPEQPAVPAGETPGEPKKAEESGLPEEFFETPESIASY